MRDDADGDRGGVSPEAFETNSIRCLSLFVGLFHLLPARLAQ